MTAEVILNFHGLGAPKRELEPGEAPYWLDADAFAAIVETVAGRPDRHRVLITFDDGNVSDLEIAAPLLRRANLPAKFFALAGRLGAPGSLDAEGLRALAAEGFTVGVHGWGHVDWRRLDATGRGRELVEARAAIEDAIGAPAPEAAVPFGLYDRPTLAALRAAGYRAVYTSDGGPAGRGPVFARTSFRAGMGPEEAVAIIEGREPLARRARRVASVWRKRLL